MARTTKDTLDLPEVEVPNIYEPESVAVNIDNRHITDTSTAASVEEVNGTTIVRW